jgi:CelD/BcsL family acetyltransferase involved in cellulose biosynthesis
VKPLDYAPAACDVGQESLESLAVEWTELLRRSGTPYPFLGPTWLRVWLQELGAPADLLLLAVREGGRLVGVAPLLWKDGDLLLAGDSEICDYSDVVSDPEARGAVLESVLATVRDLPWRRLVFWGIREDSATLMSLRELCGPMNFSLTVEQEAVCPRVQLPAGWDDYLLTLSKKDRHELRRKIRRLSETGTISEYALSSRAEIVAALPDFLSLHRTSREDKAAFMTPDMERFFRSLCAELAAEQVVRLYFLELDGRRVATVLAFDCNDEILLYNSGFDPAYASVSVGLVSKALALKQAIEQGKSCYDFLRGAEPYKYDLGARDLAVFRCIVAREESQSPP